MTVSGQHAPAALTPGKDPPVRIGWEAGWASEPVCTLWRRERSTPVEIRVLAVQPVGRGYTNWAIPAPSTHRVLILWRIDPLLGNDSVSTFPRKHTRATIGRTLLGNRSVNTPKVIWDNRRLCFPWGPPRVYITGISKGAVTCQKLRKFSWRRVHLS
jgi:hypothetical protein